MSDFDYGRKLPNGQYERYPTFAPEKPQNFVRPVRTKYRHVGIRPTCAVRDLTTDEKQEFASEGFVKFEEYGPERAPTRGRFWTERQLNSGCGTVTEMRSDIAETYAFIPNYYG